MKKNNILQQADKIVNSRDEEKTRQYGPFGEGMERAATIASGITGKPVNAHDMFAAMIALKFSRQSFNHKTDNLLDAVSYIGAWNNYIDEIGIEEKIEATVEEVPSISELIKYLDYVVSKFNDHLGETKIEKKINNVT